MADITALLELTTAANNYVIAQYWRPAGSSLHRYFWNSTSGWVASSGDASQYVLSSKEHGDAYSTIISSVSSYPDGDNFNRIRLIYFDVSF